MGWRWWQGSWVDEVDEVDEGNGDDEVTGVTGLTKVTNGPNLDDFNITVTKWVTAVSDTCFSDLFQIVGEQGLACFLHTS